MKEYEEEGVLGSGGGGVDVRMRSGGLGGRRGVRVGWRRSQCEDEECRGRRRKGGRSRRRGRGKWWRERGIGGRWEVE